MASIQLSLNVDNNDVAKIEAASILLDARNRNEKKKSEKKHNIRCVPHNLPLDFCRKCGGKQICEHQKQRSQCISCKGNSICKHKKVKYRCKECGGSQLCNHGTRKYRCRICIAEKLKSN